LYENAGPVKNSCRTIFPLVPLLVWGWGCATQADLQAEQKARESLRAQVVTDNRSSLEEVRREIQKVRGEVEELRYRLDRTAKERVGTGPQIKLLEDRLAIVEKQLKARIEPPLPPTSNGGGLSPNIDSPTGQIATEPSGQQIEAAATPPGAPTTIPAMPPSTGSKEDLALAKEPPEVQDEYLIGRRAFQEQQYDKAIQQFRSFQRKYANSDMADDAQYWIGESYFNQKDYNRAILEFNDVLKYRKGDRVPAALLRQAQAFIEIGDKTDARLILQKLLNDHPNSEQARDAKERLQALGR
jgi:tol-pal system protein YbgF